MPSEQNVLDLLRSPEKLRERFANAPSRCDALQKELHDRKRELSAARFNRDLWLIREIEQEIRSIERQISVASNESLGEGLFSVARIRDTSVSAPQSKKRPTAQRVMPNISLPVFITEREQKPLAPCVLEPIVTVREEKREEPKIVILDDPEYIHRRDYILAWTRGKIVTILGGRTRPKVVEHLSSLLECEACWPDTEPTDKSNKTDKDVRRSDILLVNKNFMRHGRFWHAKDLVKERDDVHFVMMRFGYSTKQVVYQLFDYFNKLRQSSNTDGGELE